MLALKMYLAVCVIQCSNKSGFLTAIVSKAAEY